jgi:hypothetical protein
LAYWLTFSIKIALGQLALRKFANFLTVTVGLFKEVQSNKLLGDLYE